MKHLKKLLLIHWHFFSFELVEFDKINFLTGKNASGKSTMIDALQLLMLGDANGRNFFNKAANERSARSLKGYLRCELGDDGGAGFKYLREGRFTSYIACEFFDDIKRSSFTIGVVFECYEDGTDEHRFFVLDSGFPDNCFVAGGVPLTYKELRTMVNKNYKKGKYEFPDSDRGFQEILKGKFGGLKNKYFSLFKKAVSFTPITDIETFITEYVCDVKNPVDITLMQDNIRHYKRLEYEADLMEARVGSLDAISAKYDTYTEEKQRLEIQSYIVDRAKLQNLRDTIRSLKDKLVDLENEIAVLLTKQTEAAAAAEIEKQHRDKLIEDRSKSDVHNKLQELKRQKDELTSRINELEHNLEQSVQKLRRYALEWRSVARRYEALPRHADNVLEKQFAAVLDEVGDFSLKTGKYTEQLLNTSAITITELTEEMFSSILEDTDGFRKASTGLLYSIRNKDSELNNELDTRTERLKALEKGIKAYNTKLISLRDEIKKELSSKYGQDIPVHILADLLEIRDERWRNAVEAYLHTQKFYLLVEPKYFVDALKVYDRLKFQMGFYDWGIVDSEKLEKCKPVCDKGSLAEEVITGFLYARQFIDFVMGKVMKCDSVEELRLHDKAITDSCMLYQGYVARQLNPDRWKDPFIGRKAIEEQIRNEKSAIDKLNLDISACGEYATAVSSAANMTLINKNESEGYLKLFEKASALPGWKTALSEVLEQEGKIDLSWLNELNGQITESDYRIKQLEQEDRRCGNEKAKLEKEQDDIRQEKLPLAEQNEENSRKDLTYRYNTNWVEETGEPRFLKELQSRKSAREVSDNFSSQLERTRSQTQKKRDDLETARSDYNKEYKAPHDIKQPDNSAYGKELDELKVIRLPGYRKQIQDAKDKAFQQFQDDFLAKLKSNIDTVSSQIVELNGALKESTWGNERYRFTLSPKQEYIRYYNMITDEMLLEGYNIASQIFRDKHRDAIDELFRQIIDVDSELNADARAELEKNIKRFTDYKTYLSFDLVVTDAEDRTQRLSRTLQKKSGGETQTPFYISVLASFAQLYRIQDPAYNRIRLIVFDEAFSKMDSERIQESIRLLRKFGFQCILSAPPEKIGDIAPLVDRNLCVIRERSASIVRAFDGKKLMEELQAEEEVSSTQE